MNKIIYTNQENVKNALATLNLLIDKLNENATLFDEFPIVRVRLILKNECSYKNHYVYQHLIERGVKAWMVDERCKYDGTEYGQMLCQHLNAEADEHYKALDDFLHSIANINGVKEVADCVDRKNGKFTTTKDAKEILTNQHSNFIHSERAEKALDLCEQMRKIMVELDGMEVNWRSAIQTLDMLNYPYFEDLE